MRIRSWIKDHQTQATIGTVAALLIAGLALARDYYGWEAGKSNSVSTPERAATGGPSRSPEPVPPPSTAGTSQTPPSTDPPADPRPPTRLADPPDGSAAADTAGNRKVTTRSREPDARRSPEAAAEELHFTLSAVRTTTNTVKVTSVASGRAEAGRTYWFIIETDWGNGNTDFFPRRPVSAATKAFEVALPPEADLKFVRQGRIYALTDAESAGAESMRQHQLQQAGGAVRDDTYFTNPPSEIASNAVRLPF
ncbi:hypothetical protein GCM10010172_50670 [Paractinoplanes ferrugineus]|uniref:Uncharacterized protein n=1 Tax=Paractinoplanes ferrugineus TaxID=113564 RepID=A0A919JAQ5_9ACTN|nr:hypothetical protein [Actinoplanes ferrugineus]GIE16387.1 hypothetical protein Afe05nite_82270 [Actinoplanes ferrugineus]